MSNITIYFGEFLLRRGLGQELSEYPDHQAFGKSHMNLDFILKAFGNILFDIFG